MPVYNYNVRTPTRNYQVSTPANECFDENLTDPNAPRSAWAQLLLRVQKDKFQNRISLEPQPVIVKITSLAALQCKNEAQFNHMVGQLLEHRASLYSLKEEALFNAEWPKGYSNKPEEFEKSLTAIRAPKHRAMKSVVSNSKNTVIEI